MIWKSLRNSTTRRVLSILVVFACSIIDPAWAFDAKTVTIKVGYGAGGGYDAAARLVSRHIGRFLPGQPEVIVQNVPGGGSMKLMQLMLGAEPTDGSVIGAVGAGIAYAPTLDPSNANFDPLAVGWIGSLARGEKMCVLSRSAGIDTTDAFVGKEFLLGASGKSSSTYVLAVLARNGLGAHFKIVTGFDGAAEIDLAMQRGEIAGHCVASKGDLEDPNLRDRVDVLLRFGSSTPAGYEAVPKLQDLIRDPALRRAAQVVEASVEYDFPFIVPQGTPNETLALFRAAFDSMVVDPDFVADAAKNKDLVLQPTAGGELETIIRERLAVDAEVLETVRQLVK
jgi:tripartite-type tricarboxylate transporter receptor subunit TctC